LQEIHKDYLSNIGFATLSVVAAGLVNPNYGVGVGSAYILGRHLNSYSELYMNFFIGNTELRAREC
jgi:hypothetical protein